jgi:hypothetical protein
VDGHGPATITDIQTEIVNQKDRFEDAFPDESEDDTDSDSEASDDDYGVDKSGLEIATQELRQLEADLAQAQNEHSTALTSLEFLDHYGRSMQAKEVEVAKMNEFLTLYLEQRAKLGDAHHRCNAAVPELVRLIKKQERTVGRIEDRIAREVNDASKERRLTREKKWKEKEQKQKQKQKVRNEQRKFWPLRVSQVILHLDGFAGFTPSSSRRSSIVSGKKPEAKEADHAEPPSESVSLSLTYVTTRASWLPRYEISLNTPKSSAKIVYRAEFQNHSSETWRDAKVILSTSETSFSSLDEKIPSLQGWHVKLGKSEDNTVRGKKDATWSGGLENRIEINARMTHNAALFGQKQHANNNFGNNNSSSLFGNAAPSHRAGPQPQQQQPYYQQQQFQQQQAPQPFGQSQAAPSGGGLFGSSSAVAVHKDGPHAAHAASNPFSGFGSTAAGEIYRDLEGAAPFPLADEEEADLDSETLSTPHNILAFQESLRQDYGLTTTYDLPGQRTLRPSSLKRRHVIAELDLNSITLSHVLIPKLRPAAFLRVKVKNTSNVTLLRGKAGLTLDGTFLGSTTLPACSPDNAVNLSLGVDPSILVTYAKPTVRRATSGFFNKEDCAVFKRVCIIKNTKSTPVSILVLDQVPVSEDERLRVNILDPKGLAEEGDKAKLDTKGNWGKGTATMGKVGELKWEITLEKGKDVKLVLEYEAKIPSGQKIVGLD